VSLPPYVSVACKGELFHIILLFTLCGRKVGNVSEIKKDWPDYPIDLLAHPVSYSRYYVNCIIF
jgi:hypothetical protein